MSETATQAAWNSWSFPFWATSGLFASALLYLRGWLKIRRTRPHLFPSWRAWCFLGGLLSLYVAVGSPIDALDDVLLTAHMTQHLIFMSVAPPLLLLGAPAVPLLRALPRWLIRDGLGPLFRMPSLHRLFRLLTHPVFAWLAMNIAYLGWHIPQAYELALSSDAWHALEHACFLVTGLLFWFPVIQPWPSVSRGSRWALLPYLVAADLVNTAYSASLTFARTVIYPSYAAAPRVFDISAMNDQAAAGALMWVIGSIFYLVPLAVIAVRLLSPQPTFSPPRVAPYLKADSAKAVVTYSPEIK
jgi:cytochrome c oxidase assembly factor CtaG